MGVGLVLGGIVIGAIGAEYLNRKHPKLVSQIRDKAKSFVDQAEKGANKVKEKVGGKK